MHPTKLPNNFTPFDREAETLKRNRRLPHWQQVGCTYFITYRLADSIPVTEQQLWRDERNRWLKRNPEPWTMRQQRIYYRRFVERIQNLMDLGYGRCELRAPICSRIVEDSICYFDGKRYDLGDYVIMPNHVHSLVRPYDDVCLSTLLQGWKGFSARQINSALNRSGTLWLDESFDHIVRSAEQLEYLRKYIQENPSRAALSEGHYRLGCGKWNPG